MNEIILKNQEEESTRFPPIGKGGISQSMVNLSNEGQVKAKDADMQKELEKLIGDFNKIRIDNVKNDESIIKMNVRILYFFFSRFLTTVFSIN